MPPRRRDDQLRERLLAVAADEFARKGFRGASVRDICRRARNANVAMIKYYFGGKQGLYRQVIETAHYRMQPPAPPPMPMQPREALRAWVTTVYRMAVLKGGWESPLSRIALH